MAGRRKLPLKNILKTIWADARMKERRKLLLTMLYAVYTDAKKTKSIVAIRPKLPFRPIFQVATLRAGSDFRIINELPGALSEGSQWYLVEEGEPKILPATILEHNLPAIRLLLAY
jgi:site-specific DNA recombinase